MSSSGGVNSVASWSGTWNCTSGKNHYTETFTPIFNGKGMRVSTGGPNASEGLATFDKHQGEWFYTFVGGDGSYSSVTGSVTSNTISFTRSFPQSGTALMVRRNSNTKFTSVFSAMLNGKKMTSTEVCTKS